MSLAGLRAGPVQRQRVWATCKKTHHGETVMRWVKGMKGAAFPLLKNDRVRAGGVVRAEEGQHAARLPLLHAVGVEALGIRRRVQS